jgi:hypothetical protein
MVIHRGGKAYKDKDEILVRELIICIPTDALVTPSLCTHVGRNDVENESRLTTYSGSFRSASLSVPTSSTTGRDFTGSMPARRLENLGQYHLAKIALTERNFGTHV